MMHLRPSGESLADLSAELARVTASIEALLNARLGCEGFTVAQFRALRGLASHAANTASEVASLLRYSNGATTRIIDELEDKGMINRMRSTVDRRVVEIKMTAKGLLAVERLSFIVENTRSPAASEMHYQLMYHTISKIHGMFNK